MAVPLPLECALLSQSSNTASWKVASCVSPCKQQKSPVPLHATSHALLSSDKSHS